MSTSLSAFTGRAGGRTGRQGFSLLELLVIVGIIMLLLTISLPVVHGVQERQTRLKCQTNLRNFAAACHQYAMNHAKQEYPAGSVSDEDDDYVQVSPAVLTDLGPYGVTPESATCQSIGKQDWLFADDPAPYIMGTIYWLGRLDIVDADDETIYQSRQKYDYFYDMSSVTVVTCMAYDAHTPETGDSLEVDQPASVMPHVANTYGEYALTQPNPWLDGQHPDGLAVGFLGGSAKFVPFEDLTEITQLHRIWYAP